MRKTDLSFWIAAVLVGMAGSFCSAVPASAALCAPIERAMSIGQAFQATVDLRIAGSPMEPLSPSKLPSREELEAWIQQLVSDCDPSDPDTRALTPWATRLLRESQMYLGDHAWFSTALSKPVPAGVSAPTPEAEAGRPRVVFVDIGLNYDQLGPDSLSFRSRDQGDVALLGRLDSRIAWDVADLDSNPTSTDSHGVMVMKAFRESLVRISSQQPLLAREVPLFYPVKFYGFYDLAGPHIPFSVRKSGEQWVAERRDTEWTHLASVLRQVSPSVVNFSGAFPDRHPSKYRELRDWIESRPEMIWVNAAGNQKLDLDSESAQWPWPSKFTDASGRRLSNILNVTAVDRKGNLVGNHGAVFVDVAVEASATSIAAPRVAALVHSLQSRRNCIGTKRSTREVLRRLATGRSSENGVPILSLENLTDAAIAEACR